MFSVEKKLRLETFGRCLLTMPLLFLLFLTCLMVKVNATSIRKDVSVPIPKYQVPMSTVEGYAKAKLLRQLSSDLINIGGMVWISFQRNIRMFYGIGFFLVLTRTLTFMD